MSGQHDRRAEGSLAGVDSVHLSAHSESLSEDPTRHLDAKHLLILLSLLSGSVHHGLAIGDKSVDNASSLSGNREDSLESCIVWRSVKINFLMKIFLGSDWTHLNMGRPGS